MFKRARKGTVAAAAAVALVGALAACGSDGDSGGSDASVLRIAWENPGSLDPVKSISGADLPVQYTIYDALLDYDPETLELKPALAESWEFTTPTTLDLTLRDDVKFQDGTDFDAEAVKFNIERSQQEGSTSAAELKGVVGVEVVDTHEVVLDLDKPNAELLATLAGKPGLMVSPKAAQADTLGEHPVGAGPFEFVSARNGAEIVVKKYDGYWNSDLKRADRIEFKIMALGATPVNALLTGQVDLIFKPPFQDLKTIKADSRFQVSEPLTMQSDRIYINAKLAPFDDVRVRQALNYAVDRDALLKTIYGGTGETAWTIFSSNHWADNADIVPDQTHDVAKAKQLLAEAGHAGGIKVKMITRNDPVASRMAEVLQAQLAEAGIDLELVPLDKSEATTKFIEEQKVPLSLSAASGRVGAADTLTAYYGADAYLNAGKYDIPGLQAALDGARASDDRDAQLPYLLEAQRLIADAAIGVELVHPPYAAAMTKEVKGYTPSIVTIPKFATIYREQ
ncbi:ABC transporter substrate-binding protein [Nocardioides nitrophenolicus]|uniref:ABC transporter substrate-binding protein n=1 Tax=Nocardioides nitrophenolicus TaxID=60489 RepID=UPI001958796B|nr:ABC transporter substrate-binding protein [Nocardioides nitrophenolicus]MBM7516951.1 peptide/nickel transport system permease protein/peptide/nickel transport system substrate-binding protein [Nocardioides nitrophenolicus]